MSSPKTKRQKTSDVSYELLYHPGIPGRGEFIRLMFEAARVPYKDPANESKSGYSIVQATCKADSLGDEAGNPPGFAPPALKTYGAGKGGVDLVIHQTSNILQYLGGRLGLAGEDEAESCWINQLALTALDMNNEAHDTHHPIAVMKYYEDQKDAALQKSTDFRENRMPKFFSYFERNLKHNEDGGHGKYLVGTKLSYADLSVWQVLDGLKFAFPKELGFRSKDYPLLFGSFYSGIQEELKVYLESEKRLPYSMGVFRYYPELDRQ